MHVAFNIVGYIWFSVSDFDADVSPFPSGPSIMAFPFTVPNDRHFKLPSRLFKRFADAFIVLKVQCHLVVFIVSHEINRMAGLMATWAFVTVKLAQALLIELVLAFVLI
ncbi:hypothetical protein BCT50_25250 [Vibrio lentus]|uniref:Uncharacterized protein n=1 Tax=Vibrio lentus TaxID=136468 RepID=A0A855INX0_9VIBR|nr:hypothetical protein BCU18_08380 [Vibrio lentus]PMM56410.1 hypothetical protein BCT50_25250 [Vibrio lentus]